VSDDPLNSGRQADGRFATGNKSSRGRPKGARDRATTIAEKLFAADAANVVKKVVEAAKNGESWACKLIIERLIGPAREAPGLTTIGPVDYAEPKTAAEARAMILTLGGKVARGEITVEAHDVLLGNLRAYLSDRAAELEAVVEQHIAEEKSL
jgi:F0F1-type ATP synthase gamma subunit